ncbi:MAG TPA: hypothetical protein VLG50_04440 [Candidatus Saccharimonadales bacterium]|nr:hypothetical protein [Candidatus Saccharimonadales bacterium]
MKKLKLSIALLACLSASFAQSFFSLSAHFPVHQPVRRPVVIAHTRHMCRNCRFGRPYFCCRFPVCRPVYETVYLPVCATPRFVPSVSVGFNLF